MKKTAKYIINKSIILKTQTLTINIARKQILDTTRNYLFYFAFRVIYIIFAQ